jgi:hypothetical protein
VTLVFESGGVAYGPLTETWTMAQGTLTGTVYYNSYGTALAQNSCCLQGSSTPFGGATLAIRRGNTSPVLIAGTNTQTSGCRVCHAVAAQGSVLISQHGDNYNASSAYALTSGDTETALSPAAGTFAFPAIYPDGTFIFANAGPVDAITPLAASSLFALPSGTAMASTGLPTGLQAGTPVFSPDGKHVAFNDYSLDGASLASLDFDQPSSAFSNLQVLDTPAQGTRDLYPAFLPTGSAVVFEHELVEGGTSSLGVTGGYGATVNGAQGELWWVDVSTHTAAPLSMLNGGGYLPVGPNNHANDAVLNYEPTVNPVVSGGYAWVVFTSRRLYGNVAVIDPYASDPRGYDSVNDPTPKKLWVAAIDLNAKPGADPSHPAFYLPAQELLAGNSRGYWVVDPCESNGSSCLTGDQCCSGYCGPTDGGLVCGMPPAGCVSVSNKCTTSTDCCEASSGIQCIDGYCAMPTPQ